MKLRVLPIATDIAFSSLFAAIEPTNSPFIQVSSDSRTSVEEGNYADKSMLDEVMTACPGNLRGGWPLPRTHFANCVRSRNPTLTTPGDD